MAEIFFKHPVIPSFSVFSSACNNHNGIFTCEFYYYGQQMETEGKYWFYNLLLLHGGGRKEMRVRDMLSNPSLCILIFPTGCQC